MGLLGNSGAGKSTLAAFLISRGANLITDDMLRVTFADGRAFAYRGPQRLKLLDEPARRLLPAAIEGGHWNAMSGKIMVQPHNKQMTSQCLLHPLSALFWLGEPGRTSTADTVSSTRLTGLDLARVLTTSAMNIRYHAPDRLARQLLFAEHLAQVVPVYALRYPTRAHRAVAGRNDQAFDAPPDGDPLPPRRPALTLKQDRGSDSGLQA